MELFLRALKYVKSSIWQDDTGDLAIISIAKQAFEKQVENCTFNRRFFRLAGQSGSGKTSQLYHATHNFCHQTNIKPFHIAVRNFAYLCPSYQSICQQDFREKTNGFSLKVLLYVLRFALESGVDIVLELALLDIRFEKYIISMLKKHNYATLFQIMCVNKLVSDAFLIKRKLTSGRTTLARSSNYFYAVMTKSLKFIARHYNCKTIIWSAYDPQPIFFGEMKKCLSSFKTNIKKIDQIRASEDKLRDGKLNFLLTQFPDGIF